MPIYPKRRGAPPKRPGDRLEGRIWLTVTLAEYDDICRRARQARVSLSEYIRVVVRQVTRGYKP